MVTKPCPVCARTTNALQLRLLQNWRGRPCPDCGNRIGPPAAEDAMVVGLILPLADSASVPLWGKIAAVGAVIAAAILIGLRSALVLRIDRMR